MRLIGLDDSRNCYTGMDGEYENWNIDSNVLSEAQPEIVIPCICCANWIPGFITDNDDFVPPKCGKYQQMVGHDSNDFCSLAERRTDERSDR